MDHLWLAIRYFTSRRFIFQEDVFMFHQCDTAKIFPVSLAQNAKNHPSPFHIWISDVYHLLCLILSTKNPSGIPSFISFISTNATRLPPHASSHIGNLASQMQACCASSHLNQREPTRKKKVTPNNNGYCCFEKMTFHFQVGCLLRDWISHGNVFVMFDSVCRSLRNSKKTSRKKHIQKPYLGIGKTCLRNWKILVEFRFMTNLKHW